MRRFIFAYFMMVIVCTAAARADGPYHTTNYTQAAQSQPDKLPEHPVSGAPGSSTETPVPQYPEAQPQPTPGSTSDVMGVSSGYCDSCTSCCDCFSPCCPTECAEPGTVWVHADYLLWWLRDYSLPPLVTTSPAGTPLATAGVLGVPATRVLFGGADYGENVFSGGRFGAGFWLGSGSSLGFDVSGFVLEQRSDIFALGADGTGNPIIARPRVSAILGTQGADFVSYPGAFDGRIDVASSTQLWGMETNALLNLRGSRRFYSTLGFRYLDLEESLRIVQQTRILGGGIGGFNGVPVFAPDSLRISDMFNTDNQFYGGQIGFHGEWGTGKVTLGVSTKIALGVTDRDINIAGNTALIKPTGVAGTTNGGLLALPSNIGNRNDDSFSVVPEVQVKLSYQLSPRTVVSGGYNFLYWSNIVRPGDQVDTTVNPTQQPSSLAYGPLVGPAQPAPQFRETDFWAQGLNFSLLFHY